jgi:alpha-galactosidase
MRERNHREDDAASVLAIAPFCFRQAMETEMNCRAELADDVLVLENALVRREFTWNGGALVPRVLLDKTSDARWEPPASGPGTGAAEFVLPGEQAEASGGAFRAWEEPASATIAAHLAAEVLCRFGGVEVRRVFRLFPDCPAIRCDIFLRGRSGCKSWLAGGDVEELVSGKKKLPGPVSARVGFGPGRVHLGAESIAFRDITDWRNNLVERREFLPYRSPVLAAGNTLLVSDALTGAGFFVLKEAPCSDMQLANPGCDFIVGRGEALAAGIGVEPADLDGDEWIPGYGTVVGVAPAASGRRGLIEALRAYQHARRSPRPGRDHTVMLNTWGDRGQDQKISEKFALAELAAGARLGVSHFQLDDGWQQGRTINSADPGGSLGGIWDRKGYWDVHPGRFPRGLAPVAARARELGIELCLWFNPSADGSYAHWREDAGALVGLYRAHGIRTFKIDGVDVPDKRAERNFRSFLEAVLAGTEGQAYFNLDVTAGRRFGYHCMAEHGSLFVENRYTDWSNYYPHWTLRNLWQLAEYVPPQLLQIEFLNKWRNAGKYPADDPLAPARVPFEYCFAATMMAQPLAWFEASGLPEEAFALAPVLAEYRRHQERIHAGHIFPIGEEPSGTSWTGFQSVRADGGYVAVYRELNDRPSARVRLWRPPSGKIELRPVIGAGRAFTAAPDADGAVEFALPEPFSYALYEYRM